MFHISPGCLPHLVWIIFILLNFDLSNVSAFIPEQCAYNVSRVGGVCCPVDPNTNMVCGGPKKGQCVPIEPPKESIPIVFRRDDRIAWPTKYFNYACQCKSPFWGVGCEECWYGWKGINCDQKVHLIRRDIRDLSPKELDVFRGIIHLSQTWPSGYLVFDESDPNNVDPWRHLRLIPASVQYLATFIHSYGSRTTIFKTQAECDAYSVLNFNHDGVVFTTWHRYFLLFWERMLSKIAWEVYGMADYSTPYWDWVGRKDCDVCNNRFIGAPGKLTNDGVRIHLGSPFHNISEYCWEPEPQKFCYGCPKGGNLGKMTRHFNSLDFPDQREIDFGMRLKRYFVPGERQIDACVSFHMALEGFCGPPNTTDSWIHNKVHNMIDGSMSSTATATNDPIFHLHHAFMDKIFSIWYRMYKPKVTVFPNKGVRPGHSRDSFMVGILPLARNEDMFCDTNLLGYDYDHMLVGVSAQNNLPPLKYL